MDKTALFNLSYGVYVLSSKDGNRDVGCVVNSITQVSSSPATLSVSINKDNYTNACIMGMGEFAVSILSEKADSRTIGTFGFSSSKDKNKFADVEHTTVQGGLSVLTSGTCGYLVCRVIDTMDCYTHTIFVAEIIEAENLSTEPPMTYAFYHNTMKGKTPKKAPGYIEESTGAAETREAYVCSICGYVHPGSRDEFEGLPDSYTCPICSVPKSAFELKEVKK